MFNKIIIWLLVLVSYVSNAQQYKIIGTLINETNKQPIADATILVATNNKNTISNNKGQFQIEIDRNEKLTISHLNFETVQCSVLNDTIIKMNPKRVKLNEIIIQANPVENISQSVVINSVEKQVSQPRSIGNLFQDIKGFGIVKRGSYASEPVFRAFKYEQLNVQYDGGFKITHACPNRMDPITTHVIPEEVAKIEIVKGPFTVRYGSNFGGIINLVTDNLVHGNPGWHGNIQGGFETNGTNFVNGLHLVYGSKKIDAQINGSYRNFGDYKDGNHIAIPSSFKTTDYSVKLGYHISENQRIQGMWRQSLSRDIKHAGLPMDSEYDNSFLVGIDYLLLPTNKNIQQFKIKSSFGYVDHLMSNNNRPNFKMVEAKTPVKSWTYTGKAELTLNLKKRSKLFIGADANLISRSGNRFRLVKMMNGMMLTNPKNFVDKVWQDANLNILGLYSEASLKLNSHFYLKSGLRADFVFSEINDPESDFSVLYNNNLNVKNELNLEGNISLKYINNGLQLQLALGRGVKTASMIERYINHFNVGSDPYEYVGNPFLKPEINHQIEFSFIKKFHKFKLEGSYFYSFLTDYISAVVNINIPRKFMPTTPPIVAKQFVNLDKAYQTGFDFSIGYKPNQQLEFKSNLAYTKAQNKDLNEPLPQIPPFTANISGKYEWTKFWLSFDTRLVAKQNRISNSFDETKTPGFGVLNFRCGFIPSSNFSIGFAALNVFNKSYYEHLNYSYKNSNLNSGRIFEPGRNFTTYIKYSF